MDTFHTVIIGAGPGGLSCARLLASSGFPVLVLEKKQVIGQKVCGGGITWSGLRQRLPGQLIDRSFCRQLIKSDWQQINVSAAEPIISTIRRPILGQWQLAQALKDGAAVKTGVRVYEITSRYVRTDRGPFAYRNLVGADGSCSMVRKFLQIGTDRMGVGIHYKIPGTFQDMEWHLDTRLFLNGYAWIFPFNGFASIGVYTDGRSMKPKQMLASLHTWSKARGINLAGFRPKAGLINYDYRGWHFGNRFLVGDAAGLASGLTGEGINPAIVSGEAAAQTIIDPDHRSIELERLIRKQRQHARILELARSGPITCRAIMELMVLALRAGMISFKNLEMV